MCNPLSILTPKPPQDNSAEIARQQEAERQARVTQGQQAVDTAFTPFNDEFFSGLSDANKAYYQPQLDDQFAEARRKLTLALARSGNLTSSAGIRQTGQLQKAFQDNSALIANNATSAAAEARGKINQQRSQLYSQNLTAADPSLASTSAAASAATLQAPPVFSPLGNVFADILNNAATGVTLSKQGYPGIAPSLFNSGTTGSGSSRVVK